MAGGFLLVLPAIITNAQRLRRILCVSGIILATMALAVLFEFGDGQVAISNLPLCVLLFCACFVLVLLALIFRRIGFLENISVKQMRIGTIVCCAVVVLVGFLTLWFYQGADSGFPYEASEILHGRVQDSFGSQRIYIWRNIMASLGAYFWFGVGPDAVGQLPIPHFEWFSEPLGVWIPAKIDAAHNEYLNILSCQGIFAFGAYLVVIIFVMVKCYHHVDNRKVSIAGAAVIYYCVQALFGISMMVTAPFFWLVLAVLLGKEEL